MGNQDQMKTREDRLAAKLRENLRRRKTQGKALNEKQVASDKGQINDSANEDSSIAALPKNAPGG